MALLINKLVTGKNIFQTEYGATYIEEVTKEIEFEAKVISVSHNKERAFSTVTLKSSCGLITSKDYDFPITLLGDNTIKQGYEYLKTLEEFKDAEDI